MKRLLSKALVAVKHLPALIIVLGVAAGLLLGLRAFWLSDARIVLRDTAIAMIADRLAGEGVPIDVPHSTNDDQIFLVYNTFTNAPLLAEWAYQIVPFFATEHVGGRIYPEVIILAPFVMERSFVVAGNTDCEGRRVNVNDRFLDDQADLLTTLTHELIHDQMGNFCTPPDGYSGDRSVWVESHTTTATVEVTAAMCRYGNQIACQSFWQQISQLARRSVQAKLGRAHLSWLYQFWMGVTMRDHLEDVRAEKMVRFWAGNQDELQGIVERYGELPWETMVSPGICGEVLNTGVIQWSRGFLVGHILGMPFDDSRAMFGRLGTALFCVTR